MFSGGIDSLLAAVLLADKFDKVHLITFDKGYLEFGLKNNLPNVQRLKKVYGQEKITHEIIDIKKLVKKISVRNLRQDRKYYNMETCWCVGCRLAMNSGGLIYALEHHLLGYADGSNSEQIPSEENLTGTAENFPSIVNRFKKFAAEYQVEFLTPVYNFGSRERRRTKLRELGLDIDYLSLGHSKKIKGMITRDIFFRSQPMCFSGWLIHWKRNLLGKLVKQDESQSLDYVIQKQENVVRSCLREYFDKKDIRLDDLIEARKYHKNRMGSAPGHLN